MAAAWTAAFKMIALSSPVRLAVVHEIGEQPSEAVLAATALYDAATTRDERQAAVDALEPHVARGRVHWSAWPDA